MDFDSLPEPAMLSVLLHLDLKHLYRMLSVSKAWFEAVSNNPIFWKQRFARDFGELEAEEVDPQTEHRIEVGLRFRNPRILRVLFRNPRLLRLTHGEGYYVTYMKIYGSLLMASSSRSREVSRRAWDLDKMECVFEHHEIRLGGPFAFDGEKFFTSRQGMIFCWDLPSGELFHKWQAHDGPPNIILIYNLAILNGHLVSAGWELKIWDVSTFECLQTFQTALKPVKALCLDHDEIFCLTSFSEVRVFHQTNGFLYSIEFDRPERYGADSDVGWLSSLCVNSKYVFVGWRSGEVGVWDRQAHEMVAYLEGGEFDERCKILGLWCDERKIISVQRSHCVRIWDAQNLTWIREIKADPYELTCDGETSRKSVRRMDYDKGKMFLNDEYRNIYLLDFSQ